MKQFTSKSQKTGEYGEKIAQRFLMKQKYKILECNHTRAYGEIDIIAVKNNIIHFIEVKSIKVHNKSVSGETYRPEDNFNKQKQKKMKKVVVNYLTNNVSPETFYQIDLFCVYIDPTNKKHRIKVIENIIFEQGFI